MNHPIHAATTQQRGVRRIHDSINIKRSDVTLEDFDL